MEYLKKCMKNGWFLTGIVSVIGMTVIYICKLFGVTFDFTPIADILNALFLVLAGVGIITSPDSKGVLPSENEGK